MSIEVLKCPACGDEISRHDSSSIYVRGRVPTSVAWSGGGAAALTHMMREADRLHEEAVAVTEERARQHFQTRHRLRYWLYRKTGWARALSFAGAKW